MTIDNLKKLIKKVEDAEKNIKDLKSLMTTNKNNREYGTSYKFGFFVDGRNDSHVIAIDEDILFSAVIDMIEFTEKSNAADKKMIEAIEMMIFPKVSVPLQPSSVAAKINPY